jgi:hypothetical protein
MNTIAGDLTWLASMQQHAASLHKVGQAPPRLQWVLTALPWGAPYALVSPFRTSGSTGTEMSGRDSIGKRPLHRLIDFAASELESYQKGCRKQEGLKPIKSRPFSSHFGL